MRPLMLGVQGRTLSGQEQEALSAAQPVAVMLFKRNIESPQQVRHLIDQIHQYGQTPWIAIDQEGGRVARLGTPHWVKHPSARQIGQIFETEPEKGLELAWLQGALCGLQASDLGINWVAAPVLDLQEPGASQVIGDRSLSRHPDQVIPLGRAWLEGLRDGGVASCIKHLPGHGRASVDSHLALPKVTATQTELEQRDLLPFTALGELSNFAMTAHIAFTQMDALPMTFSSKTVAWAKQRSGFKGTLVSDCLSMGALTGSPQMRVQKTLAAGIDWALHSQCPPEVWPELAAGKQAQVGVLPPTSALNFDDLLKQRGAIWSE